MRVVMLGLLVSCAALGSAARQAAGQTPGAAQQAVGWLQTQWTRVQNEGRPAAEKVVRQFPARFRDIKNQVARLSEVAGQMVDTKRLDEKKQLLLELWRVRGSLNLLALCSPDLIHELTGLDASGVAALENQISRLRDRIQKS